MVFLTERIATVCLALCVYKDFFIHIARIDVLVHTV